MLAVAREGRTLATYEGAVEGTILRAPRGTHGFGYDPIFFHPPSGCSFAELSLDEKEQVSHRGIALRVFRDDSLFRSEAVSGELHKKKRIVP